MGDIDIGSARPRRGRHHGARGATPRCAAALGGARVVGGAHGARRHRPGRRHRAHPPRVRPARRRPADARRQGPVGRRDEPGRRRGDAHLRDRGQLLPRPRRRAAGADAATAGTPPTTRRRTPTSSCSRTSHRPCRATRCAAARSTTSPPPSTSWRCSTGRAGATRRCVDIAWLHRGEPEQQAADGRADRVGRTGRSASTTPTASTPDDDGARSTGSSRTSTATSAHRPEPWTIVHGDFRADNLLFGGERVVVVDWQTVGARARAERPRLPARRQPAARRAPGARGARSSTATSAGLRGPGRRRRSRRRVGRCTGATRSAAWSWRSSPQALVRRTDRGDEMFMTMADRHARQALDLDSESLRSAEPLMTCRRPSGGGVGTCDARAAPPPPRTASS